MSNMGEDQMSDMVITRTFDAPVEAVWRAWHDPERVMQWWGPAGFTSPSAEMDFREGGRSLVCMRAPKEFGGGDYYNTWTYSRIVPMERIEFVSHLTSTATWSIAPRWGCRWVCQKRSHTSSPSDRPATVGRS